MTQHDAKETSFCMLYIGLFCEYMTQKSPIYDTKEPKKIVLLYRALCVIYIAHMSALLGWFPTTIFGGCTIFDAKYPPVYDT